MALAPARQRVTAASTTGPASGDLATCLAFVEGQLERTRSLPGWMTVFGCITGAVIVPFFGALSFLPHIGVSAITAALVTALGGGVGGFAAGRMLGRRSAAHDPETVRAEAAVDQDPAGIVDRGQPMPELGAGGNG
jgi:membrane protein DedA with SNARE-associated domain